jgi:hypothetical protein
MATTYDIGIEYLGACGPCSLVGIAAELSRQAIGVDKFNALEQARGFVRFARKNRHLQNAGGIQQVYELTSEGYAYNRRNRTLCIGDI